jgi:hypothetical protein
MVRDALSYPFEAQADQIALGVAGADFRRFADGIDDVDPEMRRLQGGGDIGKPERQRDRRRRKTEGLDGGRPDQADGCSMIWLKHIAQCQLPLPVLARHSPH